MRPAHPTEQAVGMEYYVTDADGVGGHLREDDEEFRVRELERFDTEPVDAPTDATRTSCSERRCEAGIRTTLPLGSPTRWGSPASGQLGRHERQVRRDDAAVFGLRR